MKRLENLLLKACAFTVMIVVLFFLFTLMTDFTEAAIKLETFMLIFFFGIIVALANLVLKIQQLNYIYRLLIHYFTLLLAFIVVFIFAGNIRSGSAAQIFSSVVIFTFLYIVFFTLTYFIKKSVIKADRRIDKKHPKKSEEKKEYRSLYK